MKSVRVAMLADGYGLATDLEKSVQLYREGFGPRSSASSRGVLDEIRSDVAYVESAADRPRRAVLGGESPA